MQYGYLGGTGLKISKLCLGTMTFGSRFYGIGELDQPTATAMVQMAVDHGINFFDTADIYSYGDSESMLGVALRSTDLPRDAYVIATKAFGNMLPQATGKIADLTARGASRHHLMAACEASLRRLGTDYIDLFQLHGWDPVTPLEETLRALDDLVRQGKVRYIGCSNWAARHLAKALAMASGKGWERIATLQAYYALAARDLEHELQPLCAEEGVGILPWSPLAGGFLSGKFRRDEPGPADARRTRFDFPPVDLEKGLDAIELMRGMAPDKGATVAQIALAWLLDRPAVSSVIIGASRLEQLQENIGAASIRLEPEEMSALTGATEPVKLYPSWMIERQNA